MIQAEVPTGIGVIDDVVLGKDTASVVRTMEDRISTGAGRSREEAVVVLCLRDRVEAIAIWTCSINLVNVGVVVEEESKCA